MVRSEASEEPIEQEVVKTSVGRVLFNSVLPNGMAFYNLSMRSGGMSIF